MPNIASKLFHWLGGIWPSSQPGSVTISHQAANSLTTTTAASASLTISRAASASLTTSRAPTH